jgi:hypothetical protein
MSASDELKRLMEKAIERVLDSVDKYGWSIPMADALSPEGKDIIIVADSLKEGEPESADPKADLKKRADSIDFNIRRMIGRGQLRAFAFARNLDITMDSSAGPVEKSAFKVILDHEAGGGSIAYLVYDANNGNAKLVELSGGRLAGGQAARAPALIAGGDPKTAESNNLNIWRAPKNLLALFSGNKSGNRPQPGGA